MGGRKWAILVMSLTWAALLAIVLLMYVVNVYLNVPEGDKGIVDQKAREVFFWKDFPLTLLPSSANVHELPYATFRHHQLYFTDYYIIPINLVLMGDSGTAIIAIGDDHRAHFLPDEYNDMIKGENVHVDSGEQALQAADVYVNSTCVYGIGIVVYDVSDIPGLSPADSACPENASNSLSYEDLRNRYDRSNAQYAQLAKEIDPPVVTADNGGYVAEFSTWKSLAGVVERWKVRVGEDGEITVIDRKETDEWMGECFGLAL